MTRDQYMPGALKKAYRVGRHRYGVEAGRAMACGSAESDP